MMIYIHDIIRHTAWNIRNRKQFLCVSIKVKTLAYTSRAPTVFHIIPNFHSYFSASDYKESLSNAVLNICMKNPQMKFLSPWYYNMETRLHSCGSSAAVVSFYLTSPRVTIIRRKHDKEVSLFLFLDTTSIFKDETFLLMNLNSSRHLNTRQYSSVLVSKRSAAKMSCAVYYALFSKHKENLSELHMAYL